VKLDRQTNRQLLKARRQALAVRVQTGPAETNAALKVDMRLRTLTTWRTGRSKPLSTRLQPLGR
jgi:hypothetical protein